MHVSTSPGVHLRARGLGHTVSQDSAFSPPQTLSHNCRSTYWISLQVYAVHVQTSSRLIAVAAYELDCRMQRVLQRVGFKLSQVGARRPFCR